MRVWGSAAFWLVIAARAAAQTPAIDHSPVACATADRFARLEARLTPAESVAAARVVFQGQTADWYSVSMKAEGGVFAGVLPKPKKDLKTFRYYIEVTDKALGTQRTEEHTVAVVDSAGACKGKVVAGALSSASVILQGPAGVAALPAGFASSGVVAGAATGSAGSTAGASGAAGAGAGGGGLSTAAIVGIAGGAAAAAGVAVAAKSSGDEGNDGTTYTGPVSGQYTVTQTVVGNVTTSCAFLRSLTGTVTVLLGKTTTSETGEASIQLNESAVSNSGCSGNGPGCCGPQGITCPLTGTSGSFNCSAQRSTPVTGGEAVVSFAFSGGLSGGVVSGVLTYGQSGQSTTGGPTATHSGSTTMPVTLR